MSEQSERERERVRERRRERVGESANRIQKKRQSEYGQ
jgi:hypothetical protein